MVIRRLLDLWFLAAELRVVGLQNFALDRAARTMLEADMGIVIYPSDVVDIYTKTLTGSPLRSYIVDLYAFGLDADHSWVAVKSNLLKLHQSSLSTSSKLGGSENRKEHINPNLYTTMYHIRQDTEEASDDGGETTHEDCMVQMHPENQIKLVESV